MPISNKVDPRTIPVSQLKPKTSAFQAYAPTIAKVAGTVTPSLSGVLQAGAQAIQPSKTSSLMPTATTPLISQPTPMVTPRPAQQPTTQTTMQAGTMQTPQYTPQSPQNQMGLTNPNAGFNSGLFDSAPQGTQQPPVQQPFNAGVRGLFPDIVSSLANVSMQVNPMTDESYKRAQLLREEYGRALKEQADGEMKQLLAPIPLGDATGRQAATRMQYEQRLAGLGKQLEAESRLAGIGQSQQEIQQSGLSSAGGFAQPSQVPFGTQFISPVTGQPVIPSAGGGTPSIQQYAQEVANGTREYADAISAMGLYGNAGQQFLDAAIRNIQPNFNFAQANTLGKVQGEVTPALNMAQAAINNLKTTMDNMPAMHRTGIPAVNSLANLVSVVGIGTTSATAKGNAINEARTQVANALGVMTNTTPSAWSSMVEEWFPNNATPGQIQAGIEQFNSLAQSRQQIFGAPGQVQPFNPANTGTKSKWDW
jgi:hypothetical protein